MIGKIGLTPQIIHNKINTEQAIIFNASLLSHRISLRYTDTTLYKKIYNPIYITQQNQHIYTFKICKIEDMFLVLKELYIFDENDQSIENFYEQISKINFHIVTSNKKYTIQSHSGTSLYTLHNILSANNKYCLNIPITSSFGVLNLLEDKCAAYLEIEIISNTQINLQLLSIFKKINWNEEIIKFVTCNHIYIISSFTNYKYKLSHGTNTIKLDIPDVECQFIMLICDLNCNINGFISISGTKININKNELETFTFDNKIVYIINFSQESFCTSIKKYQPSGSFYINNSTTNMLDIVAEIKGDVEMIFQTYSILEI
jgi:hypothetical protein